MQGRLKGSVPIIYCGERTGDSESANSKRRGHKGLSEFVGFVSFHDLSFRLQPILLRRARDFELDKTPFQAVCSIPEVFTQLAPGATVMFNDGKIGTRVLTADNESVKLEVIQARVIGSSLAPLLTANQNQVLPLRRGPPNETAGPTWKPTEKWIDLRPAGKLDGVVHLADENIAQRWTPDAKGRIKNSRVDGTRLLSEALARSSEPPRVLVCASAVGFYGDRDEEILDEQSSPGRGFLAEVCQSWEAAADAARQRGIRVVHLRFGIVLGAQGGALAKMLPSLILSQPEIWKEGILPKADS